MPQKNETTILLFTFLITVALLGGGFYFFRDQLMGLLSPNSSQTGSGNISSNQKEAQNSIGNAILIQADITPEKQSGVAAFATGNYQQAITDFQASLKVKPNDPETLIYLNNAKGINQNPIKIAVVVPIGGNLNVAKEMLRGVAQAQNQFNQQGGINRRWLQVEIFNDDNNIDKAQQVAQDIVKQGDILAVVGHNSSDASLVAAAEYQLGKIVMVTPTSDATAVTREASGRGNFIFRTIPSIRFQADALSRYAVKTAKKTKIAVCIDSQAEYSLPLQQDFTSAVFADGGQIVDINCDFSDDKFNANNIISRAISQGADSILLIPSVDRLNAAITLAKANQQRLFLLGSSALYTFQTLKEGQNFVRGMVLAVPWHPNVFKNSFPQAAKQLWGGEVNWRTALAYDATNAIIQGLKQGGVSRDGVQQILSASGFSFAGASGNITFLPSGDRNAPGIVVKIEARSNSKSGTGFDFVPVK
jgi:branched-chain amino acid transport system substrate-binding protein